MRLVERADIIDFVTYAEARDAHRVDIMNHKRSRRIHIGPYITLLFENFTTMRYQIQEMVLHERLVKETNIAHEIQTYNELLGGNGEVGATLMIEIDDVEGRQERLRRWLSLNPTLYLKLEDGRKIAPTWDERQVGDDRLSAVQYIKFDTGGMTPIAAGCDFDDPELFGETILTEAQRASLAADINE
jgi:hypothetical protein